MKKCFVGGGEVEIATGRPEEYGAPAAQIWLDVFFFSDYRCSCSELYLAKGSVPRSAMAICGS